MSIRETLIGLLRQEPMTTAELIETTGMKRGSVLSVLSRMRDAREIRSIGFVNPERIKSDERIWCANGWKR